LAKSVGLTARQARFVAEYLIDLNATPGRDPMWLQRQDGQSARRAAVGKC